MNTKWNEICSFEETVHRNLKILLCKFPYDPQLLKLFRQDFPSAKWSRTLQSWYVPNNTLYRKQLGLSLPEIGDNWLPKLYEYNKSEFLKFRDTLFQKAFSPNTINTYLGEFAQLLIILKAFPVDKLTTQQLNSYFLYCIKKLKHSEAQVYSRMNAIKSYFKIVLHQEAVFDQVIRPKASKTLPTVLSKYEIKKIFGACENLKHLLILKMAYGMGLRVGEICALKIGNIDLDRKQVHIVGAKGKKDRYVPFPNTLIPLYNDYLKAYQPNVFLFNGKFEPQYSTRSIQAVLKNTMKKVGINKTIGIHGLRHTYATHLLEAGTDMVFIKKLLGHKNVKTTEIYAKVSNKIVSNVKSPLDTL